MKNSDIRADINEWGAIVLVVIELFGLYYLWYYPDLVNNYRQYLLVAPFSQYSPKVNSTIYKEDFFCDPTANKKILGINLNAPRYIADFVSRKASIQLTNHTNQYQEGILRIHPYVIDLIKDPETNKIKTFTIRNPLAEDTPLFIHVQEKQEQQEQSFFQFSIPPCASQTQTLSFQSIAKPDIQNTTYALTFEVSSLKFCENETDCFYAPILTDEECADGKKTQECNPLTWNAHSDSACSAIQDENGNFPEDFYICMEFNSKEVFRHSAIETLLLPPWTNGTLVVFGVIIVVLSSHFLNAISRHVKKQRNKTEDQEKPSLSPSWIGSVWLISNTLIFLCYSFSRQIFEFSSPSSSQTMQKFVLFLPSPLENTFWLFYPLAGLVTILFIFFKLPDWFNQFIIAKGQARHARQLDRSETEKIEDRIIAWQKILELKGEFPEKKEAYQRIREIRIEQAKKAYANNLTEQRKYLDSKIVETDPDKKKLLEELDHKIAAQHQAEADEAALLKEKESKQAESELIASIKKIIHGHDSV